MSNRTAAQRTRGARRRARAGVAPRRLAPTLRRGVFFTAVAALAAFLLLRLHAVLAPGGLSALETAALILAAPAAAWLAFAVLNAVIALTLLASGRVDALVNPYASAPAAGDALAPPRTVVVMAVRNEDPARAVSRLAAMRESLDATGYGAAFDIAILSDSDAPGIIAEEERLFTRLRPSLAGAGGALYRRRASNDGFKGGNLRDFVVSDAATQELMLVLDADSVMDGETILRMARIMARSPRIGVLQTLIQPAPGQTGFTRLLRFWARLTVRPHYLGHAWWQGDCGGYGGHNAMLRVAPYREAARLPEVDGPPPFGGAVLGHDHAEAMLMRAAGWEIRVWIADAGSWEDHPLTMADFAAREQRWRRAALQYLAVLGSPRLDAMGRFQLGHMAALSVAPAAAALLAGVLTALLATAPAGSVDAGGARSLWLTVLALAVAPKLAGYADALSRADLRRGFGGGGRLLASAPFDLACALVLAPALAARALTGALDLLRIRLLGQRAAAWVSPPREGERVSWRRAWRDAARAFWAPTAYGLALATVLALTRPEALPWAAPALLGLVLSIPFDALAASPRLGAALRRAGLALIPEETEPPALLRALDDRR